jgi:hypothetical protein
MRSGRPEAAAAIWSQGRGRALAPARQRSARDPRLRGALQGAIGAALGAAILAFWSRTLGTIVLSLSTLVFLCAMASPTGLYASLQALFAATGRATGTLLTWILMPLVFYGFFLPFGLLFRRGPRDRLSRWFEPGEPSYWAPHQGPRTGSPHRDRKY